MSLPQPPPVSLAAAADRPTTRRSCVPTSNSDTVRRSRALSSISISLSF